MKARRQSFGEAGREVGVVTTVPCLASIWRDLATLFREHAEDSVAIAYERCAEDLEECIRERVLETVTLEEAAEAGGYSYSHLQHLVAEGKIENVGGKGSPRIRRSAIPTKPGQGTPLARSKADLVDLSLVRHRSGGEG